MSKEENATIIIIVILKYVAVQLIYLNSTTCHMLDAFDAIASNPN